MLEKGQIRRDTFTMTKVLLIEPHWSDQGEAGWVVRTESTEPDWFSDRSLERFEVLPDGSERPDA